MSLASLQPLSLVPPSTNSSPALLDVVCICAFSVVTVQLLRNSLQRGATAPPPAHSTGDVVQPLSRAWQFLCGCALLHLCLHPVLGAIGANSQLLDTNQSLACCTALLAATTSLWMPYSPWRSADTSPTVDTTRRSDATPVTEERVDHSSSSYRRSHAHAHDNLTVGDKDASHATPNVRWTTARLRPHPLPLKAPPSSSVDAPQGSSQSTPTDEEPPRSSPNTTPTVAPATVVELLALMPSSSESSRESSEVTPAPRTEADPTHKPSVPSVGQPGSGEATPGHRDGMPTTADDGGKLASLPNLSPPRRATTGGATVPSSAAHQKQLLQLAKARLSSLDEEYARIVEESSQKGAFMAFLCHELRNHLQLITANTDFLLEDDQQQQQPPPPPPRHPDEDVDRVDRSPSVLSSDQRELITSINSSAELMLSLVNDVLSVEHLQSGRMTFERLPIDLHFICHSILNISRSQAANKQLKLELHIDEAVPRFVISDPTRIHQLLLNLLSNVRRRQRSAAAVSSTHDWRISHDLTLCIFSVHPHCLPCCFLCRRSNSLASAA